MLQQFWHIHLRKSIDSARILRASHPIWRLQRRYILRLSWIRCFKMRWSWRILRISLGYSSIFSVWLQGNRHGGIGRRSNTKYVKALYFSCFPISLFGYSWRAYRERQIVSKWWREILWLQVLHRIDACGWSARICLWNVK